MLDFTDVNWLAVIVAGVVSFALGGIWYTALSKPWMAYTGITNEAATAGGGAKMAASYATAFATYLLAVTALALFMQAGGASGAVSGLVFGLIAGVGLVATTSFNNYMFSMRPLNLYLIDIGYPVTALAVAGIIIGVWQ
ncbi:MAG: DUF1761 domain-containing protein [Dehalococcoidia bacterium]